ncbi:MAG: FtsQ-type POTRA domain-containing protein [Candidatus Bipolaricaulota bacterium]|nr:FtsQ-type POTRA domain-containing protein [Candidatus Bipolaricaulota bacterium]
MKEGKSRLNTAFWLLGLGGVLITVAIIALYTPWLPIFDLREVGVSGNHEASALDIARAANLRGGVGLLSVSPSSTARRVSALPWIKEVRVRRSFPHDVTIEVVERSPVARILQGGSKCVLIGEGGVVVAATCTGRDSVPLLKGAALSKAEPGGRLVDAGVAALMDALQAASIAGLTVREVDVSKRESVELVTTADARIRLGMLSEAAAKIRYLEALCRTVKAEQYELIDLRFGGEATLVPRVRR